MTDASTKPLMVIYVVWHPDCAAGNDIAGALHDHYRRNLFTNVAGGAGLSVINRSESLPGGTAPPAIDLGDGATTAIVALLDENVKNDTAWVAYLQDLAQRTGAAGLHTRIYPVAMDAAALSIGGDIGEINFIRWDNWFGDPVDDRKRKLIFQLTYQLCRMLRTYLVRLQHPDKLENELGAYLEPVRVFLSSKHDNQPGRIKYGEQIATMIRASITADTDLASFFDVLNIPPGLPFASVLLYFVQVSAVVAIHSDSYSSREWCRREILEAKRHNVPLVVANCIIDFEERGFPYMSNVPVIRLEPDATHRIGFVIARLLDEVMKDYLWQCRAELAKAVDTDVTFLPRPPELISLAELMRKGSDKGTIVYPDPPLGVEEANLFAALGKGFQLRSFTQWMADRQT